MVVGDTRQSAESSPDEQAGASGVCARDHAGDRTALRRGRRQAAGWNGLAWWRAGLALCVGVDEQAHLNATKARPRSRRPHDELPERRLTHDERRFPTSAESSSGSDWSSLRCRRRLQVLPCSNRVLGHGARCIIGRPCPTNCSATSTFGHRRYGTRDAQSPFVVRYRPAMVSFCKHVLPSSPFGACFSLACSVTA